MPLADINKSTMVWTKRLFAVILIIFGLYLFGDFRINDVNVRDYLRANISAQHVALVKRELLTAWATVYQMIDKGFKAQTVVPKATQASQPSKDQDQISEFDQKRMQKLLEKNLSEKPAKNNKDAAKDRQASDYLQ